MNNAIWYFILCTVLIVTTILLGAILYGRYLRISRDKAMLALIAAVLAAIGFGFWRANELNRMRPVIDFGDRDFDDAFSVVLAALLPLVAVPFLGKLYLAWIAGNVTDAEKAPGMEGIRAWLRGGNFLCAALISLFLWLGLGCSFWMSLALPLMALLAFPLLSMTLETTSPQNAAPAGDGLSPERERVLKMLDDGKITAQESAELLSALAQSAPARAPQRAPAPQRKIVWVGAALLIMGFFLPWFEFSAQNMGDYVAGGDIAHGFGWCVLFLGIAAAALPFVGTNLDSESCQKTSLVVLGVGAIILIYLFTRNFRFAGVGLLLALAGYALEIIGVLKARKLDWVRAM